MTNSSYGNIVQPDGVVDGRYRIVSDRIPHDLGQYHKAYDLEHDKLVALLILDEQFGSVASLTTVQEANQVVAALGSEELIPFEHIGPFDKQLYLVRAQIKTHTLSGWLGQSVRLDVETAIEVVIQICDALAPLHRDGLVHGTLSPHCVLVRPRERRIALTDTSLLPATRALVASQGRPWGRTPYLSPEHAAGEAAHPASDVYVIASMLYEMIAGRPPFRASDPTVLGLQHLRQDPPDLQILVPDLPDQLARIIHKALTKEPAARYRNARQLGHILRSQCTPKAISLPTPTEAPSTLPTQHLLVPAPQATEPVPWMPEAGPYLAQPESMPQDQPEGMDWLLVALLIASLIAVLGLIPLWRTVQHRYDTPPPIPSSSSHHWKIPGHSDTTLHAPSSPQNWMF